MEKEVHGRARTCPHRGLKRGTENRSLLVMADRHHGPDQVVRCVLRATCFLFSWSNARKGIAWCRGDYVRKRAADVCVMQVENGCFAPVAGLGKQSPIVTAAGMLQGLLFVPRMREEEDCGDGEGEQCVCCSRAGKGERSAPSLSQFSKKTRG
jgi:hypothetical protein